MTLLRRPSYACAKGIVVSSGYGRPRGESHRARVRKPGLSSPSTEPPIAEAEERGCSEASEGRGAKVAPNLKSCAGVRRASWGDGGENARWGRNFSTQHLSPLWAHQALWLSERHRQGWPKARDIPPGERSM